MLPATAIFLLIIVAVLIEAVVESVKMAFLPGTPVQVPMLIAMGVGIIVAIVGPFDVFLYLGVPLKVPIVGSVLTGIILSRGSNYLYDLIKRITTLKPPAA